MKDQEFFKILKQYTESEISRDSVLDSIDIDSLEIIEILFELEDTYNCEIPLGSNDIDFKTVGELMDAILIYIPRDD